MSSVIPKNKSGKLVLSSLSKQLFLEGIDKARQSEALHVENFNFNKSRCRMLTDCLEVKEINNGIIYWMSRDCRVQDNWAMLFAQRLARKSCVPLHVCFMSKPCSDLYPTKRQYKFLMNGLKEVSKECKKLNINFHLIDGEPTKDLLNIIIHNNIGALVTEFHPLRKPLLWCEKLKVALPSDVPFVQVDAHNIVPAWVATDKMEIAARVLRPKINKKLEEFLTGYPCVSNHQYSAKSDLKAKVISFEDALRKYESEKDIEAPEVTWAVPGTTAGHEMLFDFIRKRLHLYAAASGDPSKDALSNLSPWLHFGQISAQRCALEVKNFRNQYKDNVEKFLEELIIRRELADNYCFYNSNYDNIKGAEKWALNTLDAHRKDKREYTYTKEQLRKAITHDELWNAAQLQLIQEGKMHGYIRMYWCKKLLEWSSTPEEAIEYGLYFNDVYSLDGSDPNGFVGVMWSVCGVHDHGWKERDVYGKIRCMVLWSTGRKFDAEAYCSRYGRKVDLSSGSNKSKKATGTPAKKFKLS